MKVGEVIPVARPFGPPLEALPVARAPGDATNMAGVPSVPPYRTPPPVPAHGPEQMAPVRTDRAAVASAVCGMTAVIPIVSQVAGLVLGLLALRRIAKARRAGVIVGGRSYAWTGLVSSALALAGWAAFGGLMVGVNRTLAHTLKPLAALRTTHQ